MELYLTDNVSDSFITIPGYASLITLIPGPMRFCRIRSNEGKETSPLFITDISNESQLLYGEQHLEEALKLANAQNASDHLFNNLSVHQQEELGRNHHRVSWSIPERQGLWQLSSEPRLGINLLDLIFTNVLW